MNFVKRKRIASQLAFALLCCLLGACGIEQGDVNVDPGAKTVVLHGPKMGNLGNLSVNGVALDTTNATVTIDGAPASEADLRDGQIIRVVAVDGSPVRAIDIDYEENLRGVLEQVDQINGEFVVLGQLVRTNLDTVFDIAPAQELSDLATDARVEVSGYLAPTGELIASYVGNAQLSDPLEITTVVTDVDLIGFGLEVGDLLVDFTQALLLEIPNGMLEVGFIVEIEGTAFDSAGVLIAESIRFLSSLPGVFALNDFLNAIAVGADANATTSVNFISFITEANLPSAITLGDVEVSLDASTVVEGGVVNDLQPGILVQVLGDVTPTGAIDADRVIIL